MNKSQRCKPSTEIVSSLRTSLNSALERKGVRIIDDKIKTNFFGLVQPYFGFESEPRGLSVSSFIADPNIINPLKFYPKKFMKIRSVNTKDVFSRGLLVTFAPNENNPFFHYVIQPAFPMSLSSYITRLNSIPWK